MSKMKSEKLFVQIILICLLLAMPLISHAELQGNLFGDDVVTVDGETFNVGEFRQAYDDENIDAAEFIYNDWVKRRQEMLKNGTQFGIFDCRLKHFQAVIFYMKNNYAECIAVEDEVLDYMSAHLNEEHENDSNWTNQIYNSMRFKKFSYDKLKDYANSLAIQKEIVNFLESKFYPERPSVLREKTNLSGCYWKINDYETAIEICEDILPRIEKVFGSKSEELRDLKIVLTEIYYSNLRYADAAKLYEEILESDIEVYGETNEKTLGSYYNLLTFYLNLSKFEDARTLLNKAVPVVEKNLPDDSDSKQSILQAQAWYYRQTRQFQESLVLWERILAMPISNQNKINVLKNMSNDFCQLGDYSNALKHILQAWDIYESNLPEDKSVRQNILESMGGIYSDLGNHREAIKFVQEALDLSVELYGLNSKEVLFTRNNLSYCYLNMKKYDKALELLKENYFLCTNLYSDENIHHINNMQDIAWIYYKLGDDKSGIPWAEKALDLSIKILGENDVTTQFCRSTLASFYFNDKNTLDEAIELFEIALEKSKEILSDENLDIKVLTLNLAIVYTGTTRWKEAIPLYEQVIESRENRADSYGSLTADEKLNIFSEQSPVYVNAAALYYRDNNFKDAFRTFERGRSRLLIDSYSEQIAKSSGMFNKQEIAKLNEYKAGLTNYANLIDAAFKSGDEQARFNLENEQRNLSNEYVAYKKFLQDKYPKYKTTSQANKLDLERDKNILPADTAFVDYMVGDNGITAFIFDNSGDVKAVQFEMPEDFFVHCNWYRELLAYPNLEIMNETANKYLLKFPNDKYKITVGADAEKGSGAEFLDDEESFNELKKILSKNIGDVLLAPLAGHISKYTNLIISPDEGLNALPFETLEFNGKLAVETFNISYVPSFSVLKLMQEADEKNSKLKNRQDLYAMGNAFYGDNDEDAAHRSLDNFFRGQRGEIAINQFRNLVWKNLPGSKEEINRVSKIFSSPKIFSEKSASESNLKASNKRDELSKYKYLLFSTHGIFIPYAPEYSAIVLSQGVDANEDGYVTIGEWAGLDLNSDVVFLSACESGLGDYQAGEGIVGIPYALTIAGNKNTVMSLWKVYDAYTPEFVATFFKKMQEGKSAVIAINETKREFLKSDNPMYRDPAVWSAFVMYGF